MNGIVDYWNRERGFGFLICPDGRRYFLHIRNWMEPRGVPILSREVVFDLAPGQNGKPSEAVNARYLNSAEAGAVALKAGA